MVGKFLLLALFGIAMAHVEGVGVVYLRSFFYLNLHGINVEKREFFESKVVVKRYNNDFKEFA